LEVNVDRVAWRAWFGHKVLVDVKAVGAMGVPLEEAIQARRGGAGPRQTMHWPSNASHWLSRKRLKTGY